VVTAIERYILESLNKGNQTLLDIHLDTELSPDHLENLLSGLESKGLCLNKSQKFYIENNLIEIPQVTQKIVEFSLIIKNSIKNALLFKRKQEFKLKKVYLNSQDEKIYQSMIYSLESFLEEASKKKGRTSKEKIIFWGEKTYQNAISDLYKFS
jgi:hypothetical protein